MSLPRRNFLANATRTGLSMFSAPYDLSPVRGPELASNSSLGNGTLFVDFKTVESNAVYFEVNVTGINATTITGAATLNFTFSSPATQEYLRGGYYFGGKASPPNHLWRKTTNTSPRRQPLLHRPRRSPRFRQRFLHRQILRRAPRQR